MRTKKFTKLLFGVFAIAGLSFAAGCNSSKPSEEKPKPSEEGIIEPTKLGCLNATIKENAANEIGICFPMFVDATAFQTFTQDVKTGMLIVKADGLTGDITVDTPGAVDVVTYGDAVTANWTKILTGSYANCMQTYAYVPELNGVALDEDINAVGYYTADGETFKYTTKVSGNLCAIAAAALESGSYKEAADVAKLESYLASYTITFALDDSIVGVETPEPVTVKYGKTVAFPTLPVDAAYDVVWYDSNDESVNIENVKAKGNATYTAKLEEKPLPFEGSKEIYSSGSTLTKDRNTFTYTSAGAGARIFDGWEVAQNENFVISATVKENWTAKGIGFVVGTLGENNASHLLFQWIKDDASSTFNVHRIANQPSWGWTGLSSEVNCSINKDQEAEIALVYKNGKYYSFLNGTIVYEISSKVITNGVDVAKTIGTSGTKKLGLSIDVGTAQYVDLAYSTKASEIEKYLDDYSIGTELYDATMAKRGETLIYSGSTGAQVFDGVEIAQNEDFVIYATVKANRTSEGVGFVVGTLANDSKNHQLFSWINRPNETGKFNVYRDPFNSSYGWQGLTDDLDCAQMTKEQEAKIALVYKNGTYYVFLNGSNIALFNEKAKPYAWSEDTFAIRIGTEGAKKIGLAMFNGEAQFSNYGWSTDAKKIAEYELPADADTPYSIGTEIYPMDAFMTKKGDTITYNARNAGAQVFSGIEMAQDESFVVYATVKEGWEAANVGFVVGTLGEDNANHLLFQWIDDGNRNDFAIHRISQADVTPWGWVGGDTDLFPSKIKKGEAAKIALVYKDGTYYAFLNGAKIAEIGETVPNGWGGTIKVAQTIGTEGTKKAGLSIAAGTVQFTEYGCSTDAKKIAEYVISNKVDDAESLGTEIYPHGATMTKNDDTITYQVNHGVGAYVFNGVEIAQDQDFMISATVKAGWTAKGVGFVVGTLGENNANHLLFQWIQEGTESKFQIHRIANQPSWNWAGLWPEIECTIDKTQDTEIALVYKNGIYYSFLNGEKIYEIRSDVVTNGLNVGKEIGVEGTKKIGLSIDFDSNASGGIKVGEAQFIDYKWSKNADAISEYVK